MEEVSSKRLDQKRVEVVQTKKDLSSEFSPAKGDLALLSSSPVHPSRVTVSTAGASKRVSKRKKQTTVTGPLKRTRVSVKKREHVDPKDSGLKGRVESDPTTTGELAKEKVEANPSTTEKAAKESVEVWRVWDVWHGPRCEELAHRELQPRWGLCLLDRGKVPSNAVKVGPCDITPRMGVDTDSTVTPNCLEAPTTVKLMVSCCICLPIYCGGLLSGVPPVSSS
ncbi:hypothetical protein L1987_06262 [Smallanthus sonchifolius]|uniref:Uncharacterized protein n=1 Tax=Smallanthus sonchifolius TaxID=185202 RepID=A0ACB9JXL3_9ASTR|nr:hypothetical protein L1987_06262 [Smallanthus sonchifolius]